MIKVSDKSNIHNFHLKGPGVNKSTSVGCVGFLDLENDAEKGEVHGTCAIRTRRS